MTCVPKKIATVADTNCGSARNFREPADFARSEGRKEVLRSERAASLAESSTKNRFSRAEILHREQPRKFHEWIRMRDRS